MDTDRYAETQTTSETEVGRVKWSETDRQPETERADRDTETDGNRQTGRGRQTR